MNKNGTLGRNTNTGGNRSYELYSLQLLNRIIEAVQGTGGAPAPAGVATEATLLSVLNAVSASDQDIEILLVRDTGDSDVVVQQITNYETGIPSVSYKKVDGTTHTVIGPLEYLDPAAVLNLLLTQATLTNTKLTLADTGANTSVGAAATSTLLLAANTGRRTAIIRNDSTEIMAVRKGTGALITDAILLQPGGTTIISDYEGIIHGIWPTANGGFARIEEAYKA